MNASDLAGRTMAHVAIEREIRSLGSTEARLAKCIENAPDFAMKEETDDDGHCLVARWTDRVGGKRGLKVPVDGDAKDNLVEACLYAMLVRDLP